MGMFLGLKGAAKEEVICGPFYVQTRDFDSGELERAEILTPFFEESYVLPRPWQAFRPFALSIQEPEKQKKEFHFLYPLLNTYGAPYSKRWDLLGVVRSSATYSPFGDPPITHFTIFPFYFSKQTGVPETSYRALFPLFGAVDGFFGYTRVEWYLFPIYLGLQKGKQKRTYLPWPFIQNQMGPNCGGGAFWPFAGHFWHEGVYDHKYIMWPLTYDYYGPLKGISGPARAKGFLPFHASIKGDTIESNTWVWPFFGYTCQTEPFYNESRYFWPLWVQGRGAERRINRWAPLYTDSIINGVHKKWFMWPILQMREWEHKDLLIRKDQVLYFLYWSERQRSLANLSGPYAQKTYAWPFVSGWNNGAGRTQLQIFDPIGVFFPNNEVVNKLYAPLFALYRHSHDEEAGHTRDSFLFNLLVIDKNKERKRVVFGPFLEWQKGSSKNFKILKGLFGLENNEGKKKIQLFWLKFG